MQQSTGNAIVKSIYQLLQQSNYLTLQNQEIPSYVFATVDPFSCSGIRIVSEDTDHYTLILLFFQLIFRAKIIPKAILEFLHLITYF